MKQKTLFRSLAVTIITAGALILSGCGEHKNKDQTLKVGVMAGPESKVMQVALEQAQKEFGLKSKLIQFQDYVTPDSALADGSLDVNAYQHKPYLDDMINAHGYKLVAVGKTFLYPLGAYSKKITKLSQLTNGARVSIPNDPSNESRALTVLQQAGLIKLKNPKNLASTPADIIYNPKHLKFVELDAAQLPRSLDDVDLSVINSTYAVAAGLLPTKNALIVESNDSPYVNLIVARDDNKNDPRIKELVKAFHSQTVINEAQKLFKGGAIPGWKVTSTH